MVTLEEPETALHPGAVASLLESLLEVTRDRDLWRQVLLTSHSPELLDSHDIPEDALLRVEIQQGQTRIGPLDRVPVVMVPRDQLRWLSIDHRAGFVLSLVATAAAGLVLPASRWVGAAIMGLYGLVNLAASLQAAWRERSVVLGLLLPFVFLTLHVGYGIGSLWGAVRLFGLPQFWRRLGWMVARRAEPVSEVRS